MQDSNDNAWAPNSDESAESNSKTDRVGTPAAKNSDPDGWQQYRRWISKAPAPRSRRAGVDPSLYTWKGYRSWSEQIKRNWQDS